MKTWKFDRLTKEDTEKIKQFFNAFKEQEADYEMLKKEYDILVDKVVETSAKYCSLVDKYLELKETYRILDK